MHREKIVASITSAMNHVGNSRQTLTKKDSEKAFANSVWMAAAETEYALFVLSLSHQEKSESSSLKRDSTSKQPVEIQSALVSAQDLLKKAKDSIESDDLTRAYEETLTARNALLRVEESLEKKRKSGKTKTTGAAT